MKRRGRGRIFAPAVVVRPISAGLRILLLLSMWHAPFPWLHGHAIAGPDVDQASSLARHVDGFHAGEREHGDTKTGWHVHLILPSAPNDCGKCPQPDDADEPAHSGHLHCTLKFAVSRPHDSPVVNDLEVAWNAPSHGMQSPCVLAGWSLPQIVESGTFPGPDRGTRFLGTFAGAVPLCDLLGVRVC